MCGIVGAVGVKSPRQYAINGLKMLEYRGYDSAGVGFLSDGIKIYKDVGSPAHLDEILPKDINTNVIISHTRWATHGVPSKDNSHPHLSMNKKISLVHNGLIDNFVELRNFLISKGYKFYSQTDTEIIANMLEYYYLQNKDMLKALEETKNQLDGSYACAIINEDYPDTLFMMRKTSPLLVGKGKGFNLIASDASPMVSYTNEFIELDDYEHGYITKPILKCSIKTTS